MVMPQHKNPGPGFMKFTIKVDPSLVWTMAGSREERNTSIFHFLPQNYLPFEWGVMKFTISRLLTLKMLQTKFGQDWPSISWEEDVNAWRTTTDPNP